MAEFRYPCAAEIIFNLASGQLEIAYARDENNGFTYVTLKDTTRYGNFGRTTHPSRPPSSHPDKLLAE
jgi:hypothetical protein